MVPDTGSGRLPLPPREELTPEQRRAYDELENGPRRGVFGPFVPLLSTPQLLSAVQKVGELLQFGDTGVEPALRELVVLMTAQRWGSSYEWAGHVGAARAAGLSTEACQLVAAGEPPRDLPPRLRTAHDLVTVLLAGDRMSDKLYDQAVSVLGERTVIELSVVAGYYSTLAFVLNVSGIEGSDPAQPSPPLPRAR